MVKRFVSLVTTSSSKQKYRSSQNKRVKRNKNLFALCNYRTRSSLESIFYFPSINKLKKQKSCVSLQMAAWEHYQILQKKRNARFWGWLLLCGTLDAGFYIKREGMEFKIHFQRTTVNICNKKMPQNKF